MNRQSYLEINKTYFKDNIKAIKDYIGDKELCPVIKANAYGTYLNECLDILNDFKIVAVAMVSEGMHLRDIGYTGDILVINEPFIEDIDNIINNKLIVGVSDYSFIKELSLRDYKFRVHLELETGMNRTGINIKELDKYLDLICNSMNIKVEGIYTHFACADSNPDYTQKQICVFKEGINIIKKRINNIHYIHCSASNGLLKYKLDFTNMVRAGLIMYGYPSFKEVNKYINIKPIAKLISKISFIKEVNEGEYISYGLTYKCSSKRRIATIAIGYADGIRRSLSNKGKVIINGHIVPIVGTICMDSFMVDVTGINCNVSDKCYIFDNDLITLEDIASICNTINYEILANIQNRVPRIFID